MVFSYLLGLTLLYYLVFEKVVEVISVGMKIDENFYKDTTQKKKKKKPVFCKTPNFFYHTFGELVYQRLERRKRLEDD